MADNVNPLDNLEAISEIDWARLAAYLDGEGCIRIAAVKGGKLRRRRILYVDVSISNTDVRLVAWLKQTFGGNTSVSKQTKEKWSVKFTWNVSSRMASNLLFRCLPYFIVKREQAEMALAFQLTTKRWGVKGAPDNVILMQWDMKEQLQQLKGTASKPKKSLTDAEKLLPKLG